MKDKKKSTAKSITRKVWKDEMLVEAHELARSGMKDAAIARTIGVAPATFAGWVQTKPALRRVLKRARTGKRGEGYTSFRDFVYGRLPKRAQELWDRLEEVERLGAHPERGKMARSILRRIQEEATHIRMSLFIHAMVSTNFMVTAACNKVGISPGLVREWELRSPDFKQLLAGIHDHKKDFFETHLINLVRSGDSAATIFANKTINRDRGYNEKVQVEVNHTHSGKVALDVKDLSDEVIKGLLEAQRRKAALQLEYKGEIQDAEWEEKS
jgi:hypothetical protein